MSERQTRQKQLIPDVLAKAGRPLTVPEILVLGQKTMPALGTATVYRAIKRLLDDNEIQAVEIPGDVARYEMTKPHHHHFKCNGCDNVYEIDGCPGDLRRLLPRGFRADSHDLTFFGRCRTCA